MNKTYLWVGKGFQYPSAEVDTPQARLDKYCFNDPTNWKVKNGPGTNGTYRWLPAAESPNAGDIVIVGCEFGASGAEHQFWEPAKCPLFFGGYSGGVGQGTWYHTGPTYTAEGNTWTNSLIDFKVDLSKGWSFDIAVGGGLTGLNLSWAIAKDSQSGPATDGSFYVASNSAGFRNPAENLRLKVRNQIYFYDKIDSTHITPLGPFTGFPIPNLTSSNYTSRGLAFSGVKSLVQYAGMSGSGIVQTDVLVDAGYGQDIKINGGFYNNITINNNVPSIGRSYISQTPSAWSPRTPFGRFSGYAGPTNDGYEYGDVSLDGVVAKEIEYAKCDSVTINGGTAARVKVHMQAYGVVALSGEEDNIFPNILRYRYELPTTISCEFNGLAVFNELQGTTRASEVPEGYGGVLELTNKKCTMILPANSVATLPGEIGVSAGTYYDTLVDQCYSWRVPSYNWTTDASVTEAHSQRVILNSAQRVPFIFINCAENANPLTYRVGTMNWMPWSLYIKHPQSIINKIENNGGYVRRDRSLGLLNPQPAIRIGECILGNFGALDYGKADREAPTYEDADIRVGGLSGGYLLGGIRMSDPTGRIIGGMNVKMFPSFVKANFLSYGFGGSAGTVSLPEKLVPFNPTSSTP